jgi:phosphoglycolate phosphatase
MNQISQIDLIIFDLDGTLINSIPDLTDALNHVSKTKQYYSFTQSQVAKMVGGGVHQLIERAFEVKKSDVEFLSFFNSFLDYYNNHHSNLSYLYPGVSETLHHFRPKKLAILSNKMEVFTKQIVKDFDLNQYFDMVVGARDGLAKKPSAEPIHHILQKLDIAPGKAAMVGDSEADILAAKKAGAKSIAVTYGYRSKQQLSTLQPDFIIEAITELIPIIK